MIIYIYVKFMKRKHKNFLKKLYQNIKLNFNNKYYI